MTLSHSGYDAMNFNEKIAWYNLAVGMITAMVYIILFQVLEDNIGAARASHVALSAFALLALIAFGKTLFKHGNRSEFITIDARGRVTRYPYKKFLIAGLIPSFVILFIIFFLIIMKVPYKPALMRSIFVFNVIALSILISLYYKLSKRSKFESEPATSELYTQRPDMDEHDIAISNKARSIGIVAFFCFFIIGLIGAPKHYTMDLIWPASLLFIISQSITAIVLYRR
jgi:hypothetical protein